MVPQIIKTLDSTQGSDFTFGITVQSHGKYDVDIEGEQPIKVTGAKEGMENQYSAYYVNHIAQVDNMIGNLINRLRKRNEKTILVLYGDHLPSLDISADELKILICIRRSMLFGIILVLKSQIRIWLHISCIHMFSERRGYMRGL